MLFLISVRFQVLWASFFLIFLIAGPLAWSLDKNDFKEHKILFRGGFGILTNNGPTVTSTATVGIPNIQYLVPIGDKYSIYSGTDLIFDSQLQKANLWGVYGGARYYFHGRFRAEVQESEDFLHISKTPFSFYTGMEIRRYNYFFDNVSYTNFEKTGNFFTIPILFGLDYRWSEKFGINLEFNQTLISLAGTDSRLRISTTLILFGFWMDWAAF